MMLNDAPNTYYLLSWKEKGILNPFKRDGWNAFKTVKYNARRTPHAGAATAASLVMQRGSSGSSVMQVARSGVFPK